MSDTFVNTLNSRHTARNSQCMRCLKVTEDERFGPLADNSGPLSESSGPFCAVLFHTPLDLSQKQYHYCDKTK